MSLVNEYGSAWTTPPVFAVSRPKRTCPQRSGSARVSVSPASRTARIATRKKVNALAAVSTTLRRAAARRWNTIGRRKPGELDMPRWWNYRLDLIEIAVLGGVLATGIWVYSLATAVMV